MTSILSGTPYVNSLEAVAINAGILTIISFVLGAWSLSKQDNPLFKGTVEVIVGSIFAVATFFTIGVPMGASSFFRGDEASIIFALAGTFLTGKGILAMLTLSILHRVGQNSSGAIGFAASMMLSATTGLCFKFARKRIFGHRAVTPASAAISGLILVGFALSVKEMTLKYSEIDSMAQAWMNQPQNYLAFFYIVQVLVFGSLMELFRQRRASLHALKTAHSELKDKRDDKAISDSRLAVALQSSGAGLWEWEINSKQPYKTKLQCQLGYSNDEIEESRFGFEKIIHPDDLPRWTAALESHLDDSRRSCEIELRLLDKRNKWRWMKATAQVVERDANGKAMRLIVTHNDIDSLKNYSISLEKSRKKFQSMLESTPDAYILINEIDGNCIDVNSAFERITGFKKSQAVSRHIKDTWTPHMVRGWQFLFDQTPQVSGEGHAETAIFQIETTFQRKSGDTGLGLFVIKRIAVNNIGCFLVIVRDLTSYHLQQNSREMNKLTRIRLEAGKKARNTFLKNIGNELVRPVQTMMKMTKSMNDDIENSTPGKLIGEHLTQVGKITDAAQKLMTMVDDLMDLSAIESESVMIKSRPLCMRTMVNASIESLRPYAKKFGVKMFFNKGVESISEASGDPDRVEQILKKIISNAIKYNQSGGRINIKLSQTKNKVEISVRDTGMGMNDEQVNHILAPKIKRLFAANHAGNFGVGMAISNQLALLMNGSMTIKSSPGQGTEIQFRLPRNGDRKTVPEVDQKVDPEVEIGIVPEQTERFLASVMESSVHSPNLKISSSGKNLPTTKSNHMRHGKIIYMGIENGLDEKFESAIQDWTGVNLTPADTLISGQEQARLLNPELIIISAELMSSNYNNIIRRIKSDPMTKEAVVVVTGQLETTLGVEKWTAVGADAYWSNLSMVELTSELEKILLIQTP